MYKRFPLQLNNVLSVIFGGLLVLDTMLVGLYLNGQGWDLDAENNLPTHYQVIKLAFCGLLLAAWGYHLYQLKQRRFSLGWMVGGAAVLFLALDEWLQIHEQAANVFKQFLGKVQTGETDVYVGLNFSEWLVIYLPLMLIGVILLGIMTYSLLRSRHFTEAAIFALGICALILVPVLEFAGTWGWRFDLPSYEYYVGFEEGMEMWGISLITIAVVSLLSHRLQKR